jgi:GNAT superfamily N-acetyltransferase
MSEPSRIAPPPPPGTGPATSVRAATAADAAAVASAIEALLVELGGEGPSAVELEAAVRELIGDTGAGALLVAEADGEIVGALAASWQYAVHVPGRYGTIQDLWVHPDWRSRAVGSELIMALVQQAEERGVRRLEVGLPQPSFARLDSTESFYRENGFTPLGPRMRRPLS